MPRVPSYRHYKCRDLACVDINGKRHYLGRYDSPESKRRYHALITEWLAEREAQAGGERQRTPAALTIDQLILAYWDHCESYYRKNGEATGHLPGVKIALRYLRRAGGDDLVANFGPLRLQALRDTMIADDLSRRYINDLVANIKRCFRWGVSQEFVTPAVYQALCSVSGLRRNRTVAKEAKSKGPVEDSIVEATLPHVSPLVADVISLIRHTGCRPSELLQLRPSDVDRSREVWLYRPPSHKTEHHDTSRVIFVGTRGQAILQPYLFRGPDEHCFKIRRDSLRTAIARACKKHRITHWSPIQLRKAAGTAVREQFGLDASQVWLGHAHASVTEVYAKANQERGEEIAKRIG